jgi:predicted metal-dependent enzyme (double-stranded beta helix superfamily)
MKTPCLKSLALVGVLSAASTSGWTQTAWPGGFVTHKPAEIVWREGENGMKTAVLFGDPNKPGLYVVRNIFPAGVMSAPHHHDGDRWVTVIRGTWNSGIDASWDPASTIPMPAGSIMLHPAHAIHFDGSLKEPVEVQIMGYGPVKTTYIHSQLGKFGQPRKVD